jgi:hypothetical protein
MKKWLKPLAVLALILTMPISCRQLFTTSLFSGAARKGSLVSSGTSTSDLLSVAGAEGTDKKVAADVLNALATKSDKELTSLSPEDKATILNLATTATTDMATLTNIANKATDGKTDTKQLVTEVLDSFDSSVNLDAVTTLLADSATVKTAPVDTIALASAAVVANVADTLGTDKTMEVLATGDTTGLTPEQKEKIDLVIDVREKLQKDRAKEVDGTTVGGMNLGDLLNGSAK